MCWSLVFPCPKCQKKAAKRKKSKAKAKAQANAQFEARLTGVLDHYSIRRKDSSNAPSALTGETWSPRSQKSAAWSWKSWSVRSPSHRHDPNREGDYRGRKSYIGFGHKMLHDPSRCTCTCKDCNTGCWERFKHDSHESPNPMAWPNIESWSRASTLASKLSGRRKQSPQPRSSRHHSHYTAPDTWFSSTLSTPRDQSVQREAPGCETEYPRIYIYPRSSPATSFPVVDYTKVRHQGSEPPSPYLACAIVPISASIADLAGALAPMGSGLKLRARCATGLLKSLRDFDNVASLENDVLQLEVWDSASEKKFALQRSGKRESSGLQHGFSGLKRADAMHHACYNSSSTDGRSSYATAHSSKTRTSRHRR